MSRKRVVLLARAGAARERTQAAIAEAGADVVATLDPATVSVDDIRGATPDALMVILDPVAEQALDRLDAVLADPALEIMFEDAEVAARREGWEAARWARHLNAKLYGHADVLPPARGPSVAPEAADAAGDGGFHDEMAALQRRVAAMPDIPQGNQDTVAPQSGAVVIAAGVGGPDAVRQLLGQLPPAFARPIVLRQRIEGGQYDKLVRQMQRATGLRVMLAQAGDPLQAGTVHVMGDDMDVQSVPAGLFFVSAPGETGFANLPPGDSAILLLSGADSALVDAAMALSWAGGLALGQAPENCFDPSASNALVARGGHAASLAQLSAKLLERWPV